MKISEYIRRLEEVQAEIGDVEVQKDDLAGRVEAPAPKSAYALILKGRESRNRFWYGEAGRKGGAVCRV